MRTISGVGRLAVILVALSLTPPAATGAAPRQARAAAPAPTSSPRERISINADWRFQKGDLLLSTETASAFSSRGVRAASGSRLGARGWARAPR